MHLVVVSFTTKIEEMRLTSIILTKGTCSLEETPRYSDVINCSVSSIPVFAPARSWISRGVQFEPMDVRIHFLTYSSYIVIETALVCNGLVDAAP